MKLERILELEALVDDAKAGLMRGEPAPASAFLELEMIEVFADLREHAEDPQLRSTPARISHALGVSEVELDSGLRDAAASAYRRVADHLENGFDAGEMLEQATKLRAAALQVTEERTAPLSSPPA